MKGTAKRIYRYRWQYGMIALGLICLLLFNYMPMLGIQIAFRNFKAGKTIWKETGWGTIVYLAAISAISEEMYEAARLDGAGRWAQMKYITLPALLPTISMLFILALPGLLNAGVDAVYPLMNNANLEVSTVLDVYVLKNGLERGQYSLSTAVGLLSSS